MCPGSPNALGLSQSSGLRDLSHISLIKNILRDGMVSHKLVTLEAGVCTFSLKLKLNLCKISTMPVHC